jgi:trans-2,3-dihydro-3-hydroxyanthranilate isomerase
MEVEFSLIDVFSDRPFGGNQLAVFPRTEGLSDEVMQNWPGNSTSPRARSCCPRQTLRTLTGSGFSPRAPSCRSPGTRRLALRRPGQPEPGSSQFLFEEGIGQVTVIADGPAWRLVLPSPGYETSPQPPSAVAVASTLSLPETALVRCWFAGVGLRFCFVQLTGQDMVDRATLDTSAWRVGLADGWCPHLYVFAGDFRDGQRLYSRFFAPAIGVAEDPKPRARGGPACCPERQVTAGTTQRDYAWR